MLTAGGPTSQASAGRLPRPAQESAGAAAARRRDGHDGHPRGNPADSDDGHPHAAVLAGRRRAHDAERSTANPAGQLSYNTKKLSAKAGTVTIMMANVSPVEHNVTVAEGSKVLGATPTFTGGKRMLKLTLKPGTYTFYCSVPGHRQAGMEGTLTVS